MISFSLPTSRSSLSRWTRCKSGDWLTATTEREPDIPRNSISVIVLRMPWREPPANHCCLTDATSFTLISRLRWPKGYPAGPGGYVVARDSAVETDQRQYNVDVQLTGCQPTCPRNVVSTALRGNSPKIRF